MMAARISLLSVILSLLFLDLSLAPFYLYVTHRLSSPKSVGQETQKEKREKQEKG